MAMRKTPDEPAPERRSVKSAERVLDLIEIMGAERDGVTFAELGR